MMKLLSPSVTLLAALFLSACSEPQVGSKQRPYAMYFVPSVDAQEIIAGTEKMRKFVARHVSQRLYGKDEGFYVSVSVPTSYIAVVEAFGTGRADFAALSTFAYVLARDIKKFPVSAAIQVVRGQNERTYKGQILVHRDSGIKKLEDLSGKTFAFSDPASTSGYILPAALLREKGVKPKEEIFAGNHVAAVMKVYQRQADAAATYHTTPVEVEKNGKKVLEIRDARMRVLEQYPDVAEKVKILAFTQEIPNEPWVVRTNLYPEEARSRKVTELVLEAIHAYKKTEDGMKYVRDTATAVDLLAVTDAAYDDTRKIFLAAGLDIEAQVKKGK
jgi:phosphonate transport system substrate-binding protein